MIILLDYVARGLAGRSQRFGEARCLHLQGRSDKAANEPTYQKG
jgi:hypothetical protein